MPKKKKKKRKKIKILLDNYIIIYNIIIYDSLCRHEMKTKKSIIGNGYSVSQNKDKTLFTLYYKGRELVDNVKSFEIIADGVSARDHKGKVMNFEKGKRGAMQLRLI